MIFVQFLCIVCFHVVYAFDPNKVIYAVNSGGDEFIDSYGIRYERDKPVGLEQVFTSFHAKGIHIERANKDDFELYQRETYSTNSFYYEIPVNEDGDYVIVLKFCEVYFNAPYQKVFDVTLNGIKIIENLDIYGEVGKFTAHDVYIPFSIKDNNFVYKNMELFLSNGKLRLEFVKGLADNPKINAVIVYKGKVKDFPKLPPIEEEDTPDKRPASQYRQPLTRYVRDDPYYYQDFLTSFWPMLVAAATAFPVVYCLCKM